MSGLTAILVAIVYTRMEIEVFVLLLAVIAAGMLGLKQFADMRRHLEQLVETRTEALKDKSEQLEQLATRDTLTGLRNRRFAEEFLQRELDLAQRYGQDLSVALADIDHFKDINDGYSHATGDQVLQHIGRIFDERIRSTDLIARYGGEEFLFCFVGTAEPLAAQVCEDLRRAVEAHDWSEIGARPPGHGQHRPRRAVFGRRRPGHRGRGRRAPVPRQAHGPQPRRRRVDRHATVRMTGRDRSARDGGTGSSSC